jgi:hypothetical protein
VVSSTEAFKRVVAPVLQVKLPMISMAASNPNPDVREECWKTDLDVASARSMHPVSARRLPKAVDAMWKVHRLREILPTTSLVSDYSENPVTQTKLSHV